MPFYILHAISGRTLSMQVAKVERLTEVSVTTCRVGKGYQGKGSKVKGADIIHKLEQETHASNDARKTQTV